MMKQVMWGLGLGSVLAAIGCEEKKSGFTVGTEAAGACDVKIDALADTEWVFLRANADKTETPTESTRVKFFVEDGKTKASYNVGSVADMYTYGCEKKGEELICRESPKVKDYCQALEAGGKTCSPESLRKFAPDLTDDEVKKGMDEAMVIINKYKGTPDWDKFVFQNNNLGNKLRGVIYVKVDERKCRLRITDNYTTIYNGKKMEDSNPAGTNAFVKNEMGELLWDHCTSRQDLVALEAAEFPADPQNAAHKARHSVSKPVNFWYLAGDTISPKEGCTYGYDMWMNGKPLKAGLTPAVVDAKNGQQLHWGYTHTFAAASPPTGDIFHMVTRATCEGKETKVVACAAVLAE